MNITITEMGDIVPDTPLMSLLGVNLATIMLAVAQGRDMGSVIFIY
jgi:hypothetical protein